MTKVAFSGEEQSLAIIWQWYEDIQAALNGYQREILNALFQGKSVNEPFLFMTKENVLDYFAKQKTELENFQNASKLRHWLAHGRYWTPKLGRSYNLNTIFDIAEQLLNELQINS
ncbi:hypothetical protein PN36_11400 [Candidatus Thiomargarita nelsonii]|uniref:RiboL-PSP-HEPN domain-containing protein n=1 Tax=Candidatus Thiomargarita nelsonii TaxID=1003181 RepID=A0A0A6PJT5_9GAMM|nr:hypothetical protein PN36_11400 [Candidatus Thiomargarita nelsonii]